MGWVFSVSNEVGRRGENRVAAQRYRPWVESVGCCPRCRGCRGAREMWIESARDDPIGGVGGIEAVSLCSVGETA